MATPNILAPVAGDDPCGPDLRWDPEFLGLSDAMSALVSQDEGTVIDAEISRSDGRSFEEIVDMAIALSSRTKDLRVLTVYAEASWYHGGLCAFASAMEELTTVVQTWPGFDDGVHPRADEMDADLGERTAALGRLLHRIPTLAAIVGWGRAVGDEAKAGGGATLKSVFGAWKERFEPAFGADLPSSTDAWRSLQKLVGSIVPADAGDGADDAAAGSMVVASPATDAWDLLERAHEQMILQDHHSPAVPVLRLLIKWRSLEIGGIADLMKPSGISLEQLLDSIKKQTQQ